MPFGKDEKGLAQTGSYGGGVSASRQFMDQSRGRSSGNNGPRRKYYKNLIFVPGTTIWCIFHGTKTYENVMIRRDPRSGAATEQRYQLPFRKGMRHWHSTKNKFTTCSGGPDYLNREWSSARCAGCKSYYDGFTQQGGKWKQTGPVSREEVINFSVTVMEKFYGIPGNRVNPATNEPYMEWVLPSEDLFKKYMASRSARREDLECEPFRKFLLSSSRTQYAQLFGSPEAEGASVDEILRTSCYACGEEGAFDSHEADAPCRACGSTKRANLFDVMVQIQPLIAGAPKKPGGKPPVTLSLKAWKPIPNDIPADALEPIDLDEVCAPTPADKQAEIYGFAPDMLSHGVGGVISPSDMDQSQPPGSDDDIPF